MFDDEFYGMKYDGMVIFERNKRLGKRKAKRHQSNSLHNRKSRILKREMKDNVQNLFAISAM